MKEIVNDLNLVAHCGLYCAACKRYLQEKCPGCQKNEKASWCQVRTCCATNHYQSCADCKEYENARDCKKYNNFMSKVFGFVFRSDRDACVRMIKEQGYEKFTVYMTENKLQTIKR